MSMTVRDTCRCRFWCVCFWQNNTEKYPAGGEAVPTQSNSWRKQPLKERDWSRLHSWAVVRAFQTKIAVFKLRRWYRLSNPRRFWRLNIYLDKTSIRWSPYLRTKHHFVGDTQKVELRTLWLSWSHSRCRARFYGFSVSMDCCQAESTQNKAGR